MTLRQKLLATTAASTLIAYAFTGMAHANPVDGVVSAGSADITSSGKTLDITQHSDKAIIDWRGFDIGADETTNFIQPNASSLTVNRVNSTSASQINGHLNANGNIVIINQNGIVFGAGATVDVHGLVATTSDSTNDRLLNDTKVHFDLPGNTSASIVNNGTITAHDAGLVGFVAPNVTNNGIITANLGRVHLAAGDKATVDFYGDGLLEVQASDNLQHEIVTQTGQISADGGKIALTAAAGGQVVSSIINAQGVIHAQSVDLHDGEITIGGGNVGAVNVAGTVDASSATGKGGKVTITAKAVTLKNTARVKASGATGGGTIKIGGDAHGTGPTPTAQTVNVERGATIENNAISFGDGGETIVWSDQYTSFEGLISGKGGALGGNGGFTEVSGHDVLHYDGLVDLSANESGGYVFGSLLLDPSDITISSGTDGGGAFSSGTYTASAGSSIINVSTLQTQLASANVTINSSGGTGGNGDITVAGAVTWSTNTRTLTLNAVRDILINSTILPTGSNDNVTFVAGRDIFVNANVGATGNTQISMTAARDLTVATGVTLLAAVNNSISLRAANGVITNTGVLTINGVLNVGDGGTLTLLSGLDSSSARADLTLNSTNMTLIGANVGTVSITGFRDVTLARNLISSGSVTIGAERNLTINSGVTVSSGASGALSLKASTTAGITGTGVFVNGGTITAGTGALVLQSGLDGSGNKVDLALTGSNFTYAGANLGTVSITGFRDIAVNTALTSAASINITAGQDFSNTGVITSGAASTIALNAGRDVVFNANVTGNTTGGITAQAGRNLTVASGVTVAAGANAAVSLKAAGGVITNTGVLTLSGVVKTGNANGFVLLSGVDGSSNRVDLTLDGTNYIPFGGTGSITITGFRDVNLNTNLSTGSSISVTAERNLTVGAGVTLTSHATSTVTLKAAGGVTTNIGILTINGNLSVGSSAFSLTSGLDGSNNRTDLTLNSSNFTMLGGSVATPSLLGFRDITIATNLALSGASTITADRDLIINSAITGTSNSNITLNATTRDVVFGANVTASGTGVVSAQAARNLTVNSGVTLTPGSTGILSLKAAGGVITNQGVLTINGVMNVSTNALTLYSGLDSGGNLVDLTLSATNLSLQGATLGTTTISGFRDVAVNIALSNTGGVSILAGRNFTNTAAIISNTGITVGAGAGDMTLGANITAAGAGALNLLAFRNLTVNSGVTVSSGPTGNTSVLAANGVVTNTGVLALNGTLSAGTGTFTLVNGLDSSSARTQDLTLNSTNLLLGGATLNKVSITGYRDVTINRALPTTNAVTITADRDFSNSGTITAGAGFAVTITSNRDLTLGASVTGGSGAGHVIAQAGRNLTVNSGVILTPGTTGQISLKAAGGVITNVGLLTINGTMNVTTGALTLLTGLDASSARTQDLALTSSNLTYTGASVGNVSITGYRDVAVNTALTSSGSVTITPAQDFSNSGVITAGTASSVNITASRDIVFGANVSAATTGSLTAQATRNLTINSGVTIGSGGNGALNLKAAGGVVTNQGVLAIGGTLNVGTGTMTLVNGLDASSLRTQDLTLNSSNMTMAGASVSAVSITGFRDLNINRTLTSSGAITLTADRDFSNSATITSGTGGIIGVTAGRDIVFGANITSASGASNLTAQAARNLTVNSGATLSPGTGTLTLKAANGVITNQGLLAINGVMNIGTGSLVLTSGLDLSNNRTQDLTLDATNLTLSTANLSAITITGFRDISVNRSLPSSSSVTITAERNLALNGAISTSSTGAMTLRAAGGTTTNVGVLSMTGAASLTTGSSTVILSSGLDALNDRGDLTLNSSNFIQLAPTSALTVSGFRDVSIATAITSAGGISITNDRDFTNTASLITTTGTGNYTITAGRDVVVGADMTRGGTNNSISVQAGRNLTVNSGVTITPGGIGAISLKAANGVIGGLGVLSINGLMNLGAGGLTLISGSDTTGVRATKDITFNTSNLVSTTIGAISITGFRDITLASNISSNAAIIVTAERNLNINSGATISAGPAAATSLKAAGGVTTNTGVLTLNGALSLGSGALSLTSGLGTTDRTDLTLNSGNVAYQGANVGVVTISGFRDTNINSALTSSATVTISTDRDFSNSGVITGSTQTVTANRDILINANMNANTASGSGVALQAVRNITINNGAVLSSGATGGISLKAASGVIANTGVLAMNGVLNVGSGPLTLITGFDSSNARTQDITLTNSNLTFINTAVGSVNVSGFRDVTLARDLIGGNYSLIAERDLTINGGVMVQTSSSGSIFLKAAGGVNTNIGLLRMNGTLSIGAATFVLASGQDALGNRQDLTLDSSNMLVQGSGFVSTAITGFRDVTIGRSFTMQPGNFQVTAERNLTINSGVVLTGGTSFGVILKAAGGVITNVGLLTFNGTINVGTGPVTLLSGVDSSGNRADLTLNSSNLVTTTGTFGALSFTGFRDITLANSLNMTLSSSFVAERNMIVNNGVTLTMSGAPPAGTALILRAAGGVVGQTGQLQMNGSIVLGNNIGLGMASGVDSSGNGSDLVISDSWLTLSGATIGALNLSGFRDITFAKNLTFGNVSSTVSVVAERNLIVNSGVNLNLPTANHSTLRAGGATSANIGALIYNGTMGIGNGNLTLATGLEASGLRTRDIVLDNSNVSFLAANMQALTISGFRDVTLGTSFNGSGISVTADRNITVNSGVTLQAFAANIISLKAASATGSSLGVLAMNGIINMGTGSLTLTTGYNSAGDRPDITLNNSNFVYTGGGVGVLTVTGYRDATLDRSFNGAGLNISAQRNLTVTSNGIIGASTFNVVLSSNASGFGLLTFNGAINMSGAGNVTLTSGADSAGNRNNLALDSSNLTSSGSIASLNVSGFNDITLNTAITTTGAIGVTAEHNLTIGSNGVLTTGAASSTTLRAGGATGSKTGSLINNGVVKLGTGASFLTSGIDGLTTGNDLVWDNVHYVALNGTNVGALAIIGFRDIVFNENLTTAGDLSVQAFRDITLASGKTITDGGKLTLLAAGNVGNARGTLTLSGAVQMTGASNSISLNSGYDTLGNYQDFVWDGTSPHITSANSPSFFSVTGYRDITIATNLTTTSGVTLKANRNVTINSGVTVNSGAVGSMRLYAAGSNIQGIGVVRVHGTLLLGTGQTELSSGLDSVTGLRRDLTFDSGHYVFLDSGHLLSILSINGYRDIVIGQSVNAGLVAGSGIQVNALRNLTINSGAQLSARGTNQLTAAGNVITNEGLFTNNGVITSGNGSLILTSGVDGSGNRNDLVFDSAHYVTVAQLSGVSSIAGFRDVTISRDMASVGTISVIAARNLSVDSGVTLRANSSGRLYLYAAGGDTNAVGTLNLNGTFYLGRTGTNFISGIDAITGERPDLVFDSNRFIYADANHDVADFSVRGFRDIVMGQNVFASIMTVEATRNLTIASGVALTSSGNIKLIASDFINNGGANALSSNGGRWLVYADDSTTSQIGNLPYNFRIFNCAYGAVCPNVPANGNGFVFSNDSMNEVLADLHANSPLPDSVTTYKATQQPMTPPGTQPAEITTTNLTGLFDLYSHNSEYHPTNLILTFTPELAERFGLQNWEF